MSSYPQPQLNPDEWQLGQLPPSVQGRVTEHRSGRDMYGRSIYTITVDWSRVSAEPVIFRIGRAVGQTPRYAGSQSYRFVEPFSVQPGLLLVDTVAGLSGQPVPLAGNAEPIGQPVPPSDNTEPSEPPERHRGMPPWPVDLRSNLIPDAVTACLRARANTIDRGDELGMTLLGCLIEISNKYNEMQHRDLTHASILQFVDELEELRNRLEVEMAAHRGDRGSIGRHVSASATIVAAETMPAAAPSRRTRNIRLRPRLQGDSHVDWTGSTGSAGSSADDVSGTGSGGGGPAPRAYSSFNFA